MYFSTDGVIMKATYHGVIIMMHHNPEWDIMGRRIQEIVDQAVNSKDFHHLNQTIRRTVEWSVEKSSEVVRKKMENVSYSVHKTESKSTLTLYGKTKGRTIKGLVKIIAGLGISGFNFLALLAIPFIYSGVLAYATIVFASFIGGICLMGNGIQNLRRLKRFRWYVHMLAGKTQCQLERLAQGIGKTVPFVRKDVKKMIRDGLFLEGHLNNEETCLITSHETYLLFEESRHQLEQRMKEEEALRKQEAATRRDPQVQEVLDRGDAFVRQIRKCNDDIPGEEISAKIDHMETIVRRIFQRVRTNPEIVPDLKKLMDYYLPMTVKLLNAYADMDAQPVQGENILSSTREIEATLDTLNLAFEKLLDDLFMDAAMDVSSDITVLNTMLAQEGLMDDELTKMRKQQGE